MEYSLRNVENDEIEWLYQLNEESYRGVVVLKRKDSYDLPEEILLKAEYRDHGTGTSLMKQLISDARTRNRPLRLRVLHKNHRAKDLYERLGFVVIEALDNHLLMEIE